MPWDYLTEISGFPSGKRSWGIDVEPSSGTIAIAYNSNGLWVGDISSGYENISETYHLRSFTSFRSTQFAPDGDYLIGGWYGDLLFWDLADGEQVQRTSDIGGGNYNSLAVTDDLVVAVTSASSDHHLVAHANDPETYGHEWTVDDAFTGSFGPRQGHYDAATDQLFVGDGDTVRVFDTATAGPWTTSTTFTHTDIGGENITSVEAAGDHLLVGTMAGDVLLFDTTSHTHQATFSDAGDDIEDVTVDSGYGAAGSADGSLYVYDLATAASGGSTDPLATKTDSGGATVFYTYFDSANQRLLSAAGDGNVYVYDAPVGEPSFEVTITGTNSPLPDDGTLSVNYVVENSGSASGDAEAILYIVYEGVEERIDDETVTVGADDVITSTLSWDWGILDRGTFELIVDVNDGADRSTQFIDVYNQVTATGTIDGTGTLTGQPASYDNLIQLSGSIDGTGTIDGTPAIVDGVVQLSGSIDGAGTVAGQPIRVRPLAGTIDGMGTIAGHAIRNRTASGSIDGAGTLEADLDVQFVDNELTPILPVTVIPTTHPTEAKRITTHHAAESAAVVTQTPRGRYLRRRTSDDEDTEE